MTEAASIACRRTLALHRRGEAIPGVGHVYAWSGAIPCTGRLRCLLCGEDAPEDEDACCACGGALAEERATCRRCGSGLHLGPACCADYDVDEDPAGNQRASALCVPCRHSRGRPCGAS